MKDFRVAVKLSDQQFRGRCRIRRASCRASPINSPRRGQKSAKQHEPSVDTVRLHEDLHCSAKRAATSSRIGDEEMEPLARRRPRQPIPRTSPTSPQWPGRTRCAIAIWLFPQQRAPHPQAGLQRVLQGLGHSALPRGGIGGVATRPGRRAPQPHDHGQRQTGADDRSAVLGGLFGRRLSAVHGRAGRFHLRDGLPVGYQAVAGQYRDRTAIRFSQLVETGVARLSRRRLNFALIRSNARSNQMHRPPHQATGRTRAMELIDLSREIHHRTPTHPSHPPVVTTVWNDHSEPKIAGARHGSARRPSICH